MPPRLLTCLSLAASLALAGCAGLYTRTREVKLPPPLPRYVIAGRMAVGLLYRDITIAVNGHDVMSGRNYFWSRRMVLSGEFEGIPLEADCATDGSTCAIVVAGLRFPELRFE